MVSKARIPASQLTNIKYVQAFEVLLLRCKNRKAPFEDRAAAATLALRSGDGSAALPPPFVPKTQPGNYQLTPPNVAPANFIQWPQVTPFALAHARSGVASTHNENCPCPLLPGSPQRHQYSAAELLRLYLGDRITLDVTSESLAGVTRHSPASQKPQRKQD